MRVYLAGPITGLSYGEAVDWREEWAAWLTKLGHTPVTPMRGKAYLSRMRKLRPEGYEEFITSSAKGIYSRDCFDVAQCDVLLARFLGAEEVSIGTVMEIQRAHDYGKYILAIMEKDNPHRHAFVEQACSLVTETDEEALDILAVLGEGY